MKKLKKFWDAGVSFARYLEKAKSDLAEMTDEKDSEMKEYYKLGIQRMERMMERYVPAEEHKAILNQKKFDGKILIISEPWCGDASQVVPVLTKFFQDQNVRITYRDQESSLIDDYLTNGAKSIPVVIIMNNEYEVISTWGARPKFGKELLTKHKENPELYTKDQFHNDLQVYYARNKGYDTIKEIVDLI
ncbi:MAG: thioredoxin family protein [Saprospiraceae bacterium]|nr:thioredoxin family protein [Saprospiraceae bacterium]